MTTPDLVCPGGPPLVPVPHPHHRTWRLEESRRFLASLINNVEASVILYHSPYRWEESEKKLGNALVTNSSGRQRRKRFKPHIGCGRIASKMHAIGTKHVVIPITSDVDITRVW